ncbi:TIGR03943 family protein [Amycolatopsis sp. FDAARGOS 1241]|uniref:TIGR03943 family putative permease subunit n=1 Tax=Amycolatopsis sp. FDAARGOS 1241 TaxID=2778070 RepID=UPI0019510884|nr:TIGR03943 family protein [Amycolatopsis sp. FDAARGOS 1241]QRP48408.1 TIGR03943 family protein [Amycolatopsis sp. FDAARGOS 1241]
MRRETQNVLLILLGGALVKIAVNRDYLRYVKPAQQPWIIAGGVVMLVLGAVAILRDLFAARAAGRAEPGPELVATAAHHGHEHGGLDPAGSEHGADLAFEAPEHDDGHGHAHPARSAWLLVVPVLAVFLVAPPALGADSVTRTEARVPQSAATTSAAAFPPLPAGKVVDLPVNEVVTRAGWDSNGTLNGRTIGMSGFVVHTDGRTLLARLVISCCAADAAPVTVRLKGGAADRFPSDTWLEVTGTVVPGTANEANGYTPDFVPATVERIAAPQDPYEY